MQNKRDGNIIYISLAENVALMLQFNIVTLRDIFKRVLQRNNWDLIEPLIQIVQLLLYFLQYFSL